MLIKLIMNLFLNNINIINKYIYLHICTYMHIFDISIGINT